MTLTAPDRPLTRTYRVLSPDATAVATLCDELSVSPVLARILVNRGLADTESAEAFLLGGHDLLLDPERLDGMREAADLVACAVRDGRRIMVHGDYDADGVSGTALLVSFLRDIGADVIPYIPHRIDEGYGLSAEGARLAAEQGVYVMVSVDCGSSSPQVIELAQSLGVKVVVTDHHMVASVPPADAFVNPRAPNSTYPFPHLSGAGVTYKLVCALSTRLGCGEPASYLDLAAIGTVGDVVPLIGENRVLVREGLAVMERLERPGIAAMARLMGVGSEQASGRPPMNARDIAFGIAPRINACGRLEHAMQAAELLLEQDEERAAALAAEVDALNLQRREKEAAVRLMAEEAVAERALDGMHAIVEAHVDWHQGIVGITASRLLEKYGLPSFVISINDDGTAKGSARAPSHVDLYACLTQCKDLFTHYGGHPRAGGFSLPAANIDALRERLQMVVPTVAGPPEPALLVDLELPLAEVDLSLAEELESLAPFGQGNALPLFMARGIQPRYAEIVKERHWKFQASQGEASARCIAFNLVERLPAVSSDEAYDMIYEIELDHWRGEARVSFKVRELIPLGRAASDRPSGDRTRAGNRPLNGQANGNGRTNGNGSGYTNGNGRVGGNGQASGGNTATPRPAPTRTDGQPDPPSNYEREPGRSPLPQPPISFSPGGPTAPPTGLPPQHGWLVEDHRQSENRGRYLADVVAQGTPVVVLCRRDQVAFVQRIVAGGESHHPSNLQVLAWGQALDLEAGRDVVLFTPPSSPDDLAPLRNCAGGRCHVLFGREELAEQEALVASVSMDRERLAAVYRQFKNGASAQGVFSERQFAAMLEGAPAPVLKVETLKVVARILCEIGVLEASTQYRGTYRFSGTRAELEGSATFRRYSALRTSWTAVRAAFEGADISGLLEEQRREAVVST